MPYHSYETPTQALENARKLCAAGADGIKVEGNIPEIVSYLVAHTIDVCAHLGFTPQSNDRPGLQAKTSHEALVLIENAHLLEAAGAIMLVLELIPEEVAHEVTRRLTIPTVGIGAGRSTDGQVLVVHDMLGVNAANFRHNKKYERFNERGLSAIQSYIEDVRQGQFPLAENTRHISEEALQELRAALHHAHCLRA
jgi:3-methyl-2-oxobutanoate hydroxymethyltransferase